MISATEHKNLQVFLICICGYNKLNARYLLWLQETYRPTYSSSLIFLLYSGEYTESNNRYYIIIAGYVKYSNFWKAYKIKF
jgi:hypothetical protein